METLISYVYGFIPGAVLGAIFGVLWGRKHPKLVEQTVAEAKSLKTKI